MISVCLASYNGEEYIKEQVSSILRQLSPDDELIISDDGSQDKTIDILYTFQDPRIKIFFNDAHNLIRNFENCISLASGNYIFLSDQDDVWEDNKIAVCMKYLQKYDFVVSNCSVVDKYLNPISDSFFDNTKVSLKITRSIIHNTYLGCCMAFKKEIKDVAIPFPRKIAMHDIWIGLCAQALFKTKFIPQNLIKYRRHGNNNSPTGEKSTLSLFEKISYRLYFIFALGRRVVRYKLLSNRV